MEPEWPALIVEESENGPIWELFVGCKEEWDTDGDLCCQGGWGDNHRLIDRVLGSRYNHKPRQGRQRATNTSFAPAGARWGGFLLTPP